MLYEVSSTHDALKVTQQGCINGNPRSGKQLLPGIFLCASKISLKSVLAV